MKPKIGSLFAYDNNIFKNQFILLIINKNHIYPSVFECYISNRGFELATIPNKYIIRSQIK